MRGESFMYSYEIDNCIKEYNYNLPSKLYLKICKESPQISEVKYEPFENKFSIKTKDSYFWKFGVYAQL